MGKVNLITDGSILFDDFTLNTLNPMYSLTPDDTTRYSVTERTGYLRLKHGDSPFHILLPMPTDSFIMEVKNDYIPLLVGDMAGIVVFRGLEEYVDLLEYYDANTSSSVVYPYMRMVRQGNTYSGYGSNDGMSWVLIGSVVFDDASMIGVVIRGSQSIGMKTFDVDYIKINRNRYIKLENLPLNYKVELYNASNVKLQTQTVLPTYTGVTFDVWNIPVPFNGYLKVYNEVGALLETTPTQVMTIGHEFYYGLKLDLYLLDSNNVQSTPTAENFLGYMVGGQILQKARIKNNQSNAITGIRVEVAQYGGQYGYQWVDVAFDVSGNPGNFSDLLTIDTLSSGQQVDFWILITRDINMKLSSTDAMKFNILVSNN